MGTSIQRRMCIGMGRRLSDIVYRCDTITAYMPNQRREYSHSLSHGEKKKPHAFARSIESILNDEIFEAKQQYPGYLDSIEQSTQMLSLDISEIIYELLHSLHLSFDRPLSIEFAVLQYGTNAFFEYNDEGQLRVVLNLVFLAGIARETQKGNGFDANAQLRYLLAHEFFHIYSKVRYPAVMKRSAEATKTNRTDTLKYDLDLGERGVDLFAI